MADDKQPHIRPFQRTQPLPPPEPGAMASEEHRRLVAAGIDPPKLPPVSALMDEANAEARAQLAHTNGHHEDEDEPPARVVAVNMAEVELKPVDWLWHPWMAYGKLCVLDGDPSLGKSTLALTFAACVSTGLRFPNELAPLQAREPANVVILSAEDGTGDTIKPRLIEANARLENITVIQSVTTSGQPTQPHLPEDITALRNHVMERNARFVIVDVLAAYTGGRGMNSHADADIRTVLAPLAMMAEDTHAVVLALRHLNKTSSEHNAMYRGGGSIAIVGAARHAFVVATHPEDDTRRVFACVKNNLERKPEPMMYSVEKGRTHNTARVVFYDEACDVTLEAMMRGKKDERRTYGDAPTKKSVAADFITGMLEDGPRPATEVVELASMLEPPISKTTMYATRKELGVELIHEQLDNGTHRKLWKLPDSDDE